MEENIFEIIIDHQFDQVTKDDPQRSIAKEITSHVMEFIEWIKKNARIDIVQLGIGLHSGSSITHKEITSDELYQYWLKNITK
jgi:hypothetical protein